MAEAVFDHIYTCACCGHTVDLDYYSSDRPCVKRMIFEHLCFNCSFWMNFIEKPIPGISVVDGKLMTFPLLPNNKQGWVRCRKGLVYARDMATGNGVANEDHYVLAEIPERFKPMLPDQYRLISEDTYIRITRRQSHECILKGCLDRYHCLWYNAAKMEANGAWNTIPDDYQVGSENCESFIDKNNMYNADTD